VQASEGRLCSIYTYRVIQEEGSVFSEVTVSVIMRIKKVHVNMCLILNVYGDSALGIYEGWNFNSGNHLFTTDTK